MLLFSIRTNMEAIFSNEQAIADLSNQPTGEKNDNKQEIMERKLKFRHLTDEMLEIYRRMSEESDLYKRQYEEAAFKVYGTLPSGKQSFQTATKKKGE